MGSKLIAILFQRFRQLLYRLLILFDIRIRFVLRIERRGFRVECLIRAVAKYSIVTGKSKRCLMSMVREVRMLLYKVIQNRHNIIISYRDLTVLIRILQFRLAFLVENHLIGKAFPLHINIVIHIIL